MPEAALGYRSFNRAAIAHARGGAWLPQAQPRDDSCGHTSAACTGQPVWEDRRLALGTSFALLRSHCSAPDVYTKLWRDCVYQTLAQHSLSTSMASSPKRVAQ